MSSTWAVGEGDLVAQEDNSDGRLTTWCLLAACSWLESGPVKLLQEDSVFSNWCVVCQCT